MAVGSQIITDEWDPRIGVLLSPDLDRHFNNFELSFYIQVASLLLIIQCLDWRKDFRSRIQIQHKSWRTKLHAIGLASNRKISQIPSRGRTTRDSSLALQTFAIEWLGFNGTPGQAANFWGMRRGLRRRWNVYFGWTQHPAALFATRIFLRYFFISFGGLLAWAGFA